MKIKKNSDGIEKQGRRKALKRMANAALGFTGIALFGSVSNTSQKSQTNGYTEYKSYSEYVEYSKYADYEDYSEYKSLEKVYTNTYGSSYSKYSDNFS